VNAQIIITAGISIGVTFLGKFLYDSFVSGRVEKGVYRKIVDCEKHQLRTEVARHDVKIIEHDRQLEQGNNDFRRISADISAIKESLARMAGFLEHKVESIVIKSKE